MTTPRDDIAGLSERLAKAVNDGMEGAGTLPAKDSVKVRPRDWRKIIDVSREAATQLDSLIKERDALKAERDKWDRRVAYDELQAREYENRATQQRQIDALTIRAEAAEQERDALQARVKELERQLASARRSLDQQTQMASEEFCRALRAEQERDEAYERAAKEAEGPLFAGKYRGSDGHNWWHEKQPDGYGHDYGNGRLDAAAAIRRLAAGPEKEKKE